MAKDAPETPDGRYFVAKGRLWRKTDPGLDDSTRRAHIKALMQARHALGQARSDAEIAEARARSDAAKRALGERGPVWWTDGAPDESRRAPWMSSYAEWWDGLEPGAKSRGAS